MRITPAFEMSSLSMAAFALTFWRSPGVFFHASNGTFDVAGMEEDSDAKAFLFVVFLSATASLMLEAASNRDLVCFVIVNTFFKCGV